MIGFVTSIKLASTPFQNAIKPSSFFIFFIISIIGLFSLDCLVCRTQKGFVAKEPTIPARPEHLTMPIMELGSVCRMAFNFQQTTKQIPQANPFPISNGFNPWQNPFTPWRLYMAMALLAMELSSWLSCISIFNLSIGQRIVVTMVDEVIEAARSIILKFNELVLRHTIHIQLIFIPIDQMNCEKHNLQIKFVCMSDACYNLPLCIKCSQEHSKRHNNTELIAIYKAFIIAENNLQKQKEIINDLLTPFIRRKQLTKKIEDQKNDLRREKERLISFIDDYIQEEIRKLTRENSSASISNADKILQKDFEEKKKEINSMLLSFKRNSTELQKAMNCELHTFLENISKNNANIYNKSSFKFYSSLNHEINLSRLELTSQNLTTKPLRKVMNESPLYFLIDSTFNSGNCLYNFNPKKQLLYFYHIEEQSWSTDHINCGEMPQQGTAIYLQDRKIFLWIGGVFSNRRKSNLIYMYSCQQKLLQTCELKVARSSCMAVFVKGNNKRSGVLIVGGVGQNGQILKSCEYLDLQENKVISQFSQTNFSTFSGTLVTFNNTTVLRLGGLSKNKNDYSVVEVVQKLDCQQWLEGKTNSYPKWSYIQFQLPTGDYIQKPRLFYANQAAIQINPNEIFVFGGLDAGLRGTVESYLIGVQQFSLQSRQIGLERELSKIQKFCVRWTNEKPLITGDDFRSLQPVVYKQKVVTLQNIGSGEIVIPQKRLLQFDMYEWYETENILPQ